MSHEITRRADGFDEIAFVGQTPWHGLGQSLERNASMETWRTAAGLDWSINTAPVTFQNGTVHQYEGQRVLYRSDTNAPLSIVSDRYKEVQPAAVLEFFQKLVDAKGYRLHTAGTIHGGRRIWALAETGNVAEIAEGDAVGAFLLLATSCDKAMATTARFTSVRVVCNNTLSYALTNGTRVVTVPHSTRFNASWVHDCLGIQTGGFHSFINNMRALSGKQMTSDGFKNFMTLLLEPRADLPVGVNFKLADCKAYNKIRDLFDGAGRGSQMSGVYGTYWGAVNAVSEYVDHGGNARTVDARLNRAWFGEGDNLKSDAVSIALAI